MALRYIDNRGAPATTYPFNPNGSPDGITGVTTPDGRFTIMMPHPERVFRTVQMSWRPEGSNTGNAGLTVTGITVSAGLSGALTANWSSGSIGPGSSQNVTVTFKPTATQAYSGTLTVTGDQTSGTSTVNVSGTGTQAAPILPANLVATGGLAIPSQCEALRALNWGMGIATTTCTSFSGTMQNTGTGCASNIRGTTIAYTSANVQVGAATWTYGGVVRPNDVFAYLGRCPERAQRELDCLVVVLDYGGVGQHPLSVNGAVPTGTSPLGRGSAAGGRGGIGHTRGRRLLPRATVPVVSRSRCRLQGPSPARGLCIRC